jgi:hypothetical protein
MSLAMSCHIRDDGYPSRQQLADGSGHLTGMPRSQLHRTSDVRKQTLEFVVADASMESETVKHFSLLGVALDICSARICHSPNDVEVNVFASRQEIKENIGMLVVVDNPEGHNSMTSDS